MPSTPLCRPRIQARPKAVTNIGTARMRWKRSIQAPGFGSRRRSAGYEAEQGRAVARPSPRPANTASAAQVGRTRAAPRAKPRNGPVHGVATNARERAGEEGAARAAAARQAVAAGHRPQPEQAGEVQRNGGHQQQQEQDHPRILQLERPADDGTAGAQGEQHAAEREAGKDDAGGIGKRLASGAVAPSLRHGRGSAPSG